MTDLSIIVGTCNRPGMLANCLYQIKNQVIENLNVEVIVIDESDDNKSKLVVDVFSDVVDKYFKKQKQGACGAFAKDFGLSHSNGKYVCFWDDDNIYYLNALSVLYSTAYNHDIGVVCVNHFKDDGTCVIIPEKWNGKFVFKQIDTMCVCVKSELAKLYKWSDYVDRGTDYQWLIKLSKENPIINNSTSIIGYHL